MNERPGGWLTVRLRLGDAVQVQCVPLTFQLALRQVEGFARSTVRLLGMKPPIPDHSTLSRRGRGFAGRNGSSPPGWRQVGCRVEMLLT
jgi:hypothetical protein